MHPEELAYLHQHLRDDLLSFAVMVTIALSRAVRESQSTIHIRRQDLIYAAASAVEIEISELPIRPGHTRLFLHIHPCIAASAACADQLIVLLPGLDSVGFDTHIDSQSKDAFHELQRPCSCLSKGSQRSSLLPNGTP